MKINRVCILGGTGFVGRHLAARLSRAGIRCRIPSRNPQRHGALRLLPGVELTRCESLDTPQLQEQLEGCDCAVNLVGILNPLGKGESFQSVHVALGDGVVEACKKAGVRRLLHMSALNASETSGASRYLKTKGEAENRIHTFGQPQIKVTSFRPSVIFGPDDSFFNRFASLLQLPGPFPLACPAARFAPVCVDDVAEAMWRTLDDRAAWGARYELCGPEVFTLEELVRYTAQCLGRRKSVIGLGDGLSRLQAKLLGMAPGKPFTIDNYLSMQVESVCGKDGLGMLGITPTSIEAVVPYFLGAKSERARYLELRRTT